MSKIKALEAQIAELKAEVARLERENNQLALSAEAAKPPRRSERPNRRVFEFDPSVRGDFARAAELAREHGGSVRRAQQ